MSKIDKDIMDMLQTIKDKKDKLADIDKVKKQTWKTVCSIAIVPGLPINIQTASESTIIEVTSHILMQQDYSLRACELLDYKSGYKSDQYKGFTFSEWLADCQKRIAILKYSKEKNTLDKLEQKINEILPEEKRRELELESIKKELEGL